MIPSKPSQVTVGRLFRIVALCLVLAGLATASAEVANVSADTYVTTALPNTNFGGRSNLAVSATSTALLRFDLSNLPAGTTSAQVAKATLTVYVNRMNAAGRLNLFPLGSAFAEFGVTSSTQPLHLSLPTATANVTVAGSFVSFDVTAIVQGWVTTPDSNDGVELVTPSADVLLDSKENDLTGHAAVIDITLENQGPAGSPGPQGPAGPAGPAGTNGLNGLNGGLMFSVNLTFPTPNSNQLAGPVTGIAVASPGFLQNALALPAACVATNFSVVAYHAVGTSAAEVELVYGTNEDSSAFPALNCSVQANQGAPVSCSTQQIYPFEAGTELFHVVRMTNPVDFQGAALHISFTCN